MIKVTTNSRIVINSIKKRAAKIDSSSDLAIQKTTAEISTYIKERTLSGKDKNGKKFAKYANSTLKAKKKRGGKFFTGVVNLNDTGKMMGSLQPKRVSSKVGIVGFTRHIEAQKAARNINGSRHRPKRDFFGLSNNDKTRFIKMYKDLLKI